MQSNLLEQTEVRHASDRRGVPIRVQALSKAFAGRTVLAAVDLHVAAGEFVAVVGRSGCGKSTLLRLIAGLDRADHGEVVVDGDAEVRIMFQEARLLPWKSVQQNVALGLPRRSRHALEALEQVGLASRAGDWPAVLSGGQRQRVALARALVHEPDLLLLDEPLGALDALTRIEMQQLIESLWRERQFTAVLVTHDVQEAIALADRVVLIEDGRITLDLAVSLARPRSRGDAAFAALEAHILSRLLQHPAAADARPLAIDVPLKPFSQLGWAI
ncbi:sulfonate transport system ATP-binding protein [Actimicrobium sp. GrIS 1.19]|uniref:ATP-binding cassette domain-containing protein n=1 Tax=Actimicrobium sp. GrIS 1.19 TaxID=3071708 RepID=UPI002E04D6FA|nr:sulfonate transport system ATP-binding protein [Actimicrobium sp. GrIS 1.19]